MSESVVRKGRSPWQWLTDSPIPAFVTQIFISTLGALLLGMIFVYIPAILLASVTRNSSGGNFADHVLAQRVFILLNKPYFIAPIAAGFVLGLFGRRVFRNVSGALVWTVPMIILVLSIAAWRTGGFHPYSKEVWNNFFGAQCGSSECAYEWLVTAPFYTSLAYAIGWIVKNLGRQKTAID